MLYSLAQKGVRAARVTRNRLQNAFDVPVVVLIYHRVTTLAADPQLLAVTPENFRAQLKYLKENYHLVRFEDDWSEVDSRAVAVTFDDGYADNALEALPIIEEVGVPVTFFVATGTLDTRREFWWDELERVLLRDGEYPPHFRLEGVERSWPTATPQAREELYRDLHHLIMQVDAPQREGWLRQLREWAQLGADGRVQNRPLSQAEVRVLARSPWVTLGAHTVTHTPLTVQSAERQMEEILASKLYLEKLTGREIPVFSYPFGRKADYNPASLRICREAGFVKAAANFPGQAHRWSDPYQLPRQLVRNWDAATFAEKMQGFWLQ